MLSQYTKHEIGYINICLCVDNFGVNLYTQQVDEYTIGALKHIMA